MDACVSPTARREGGNGADIGPRRQKTAAQGMIEIAGDEETNSESERKQASE